MTGFDHCNFFVKKKKRFCRMTVKKGKNFCGEHELSDGTPIADRIACPLDPTHSCYKSKLSKHLKVCNAQRLIDSAPNFLVEGFNSGQGIPISIKSSLSEIDEAVVYNLISKIEKSYEKLPQFPEEILNHGILNEQLKHFHYGPQLKKHMVQNASLLGHLHQADLLLENTCYIEFGAGKGKLTYWLGQCIKQFTNSSIMLVDKSSHRHKKDNKLKNEEVKFNVMRIRGNIRDLKLSKVPGINEFIHKVGVAKHLCGAASDLSIRCLINYLQECEETETIGIVIAFCCHHCCDFKEYVGHDYLYSEGFTSNDFLLLCKIASWATCGMTKQFINSQKSLNQEEVGFKVKTLLNWGRLKYLESQGFICKLVYYTKIDVTLENMCLVATKKMKL